ncbi:MAG: carbonic anhydrase [bacterium]
MNRRLPVNQVSDIFSEYRDTPIGRFLEYHNLGRPFDVYPKAEMLIGMCMDNRKHLNAPDQFAFIIRSGGANMRASEFKISFAIGVGGVRAMALIGHTQCGMINLPTRREKFIDGLVEAGWNRDAAAVHFEQNVASFEIGNEETFTLSEANRLRARYPKVLIAPMIYPVEDNRLYLLKD